MCAGTALRSGRYRDDAGVVAGYAARDSGGADRGWPPDRQAGQASAAGSVGWLGTAARIGKRMAMEVRAIPVDAVGASALNTRKDRAATSQSQVGDVSAFRRLGRTPVPANVRGDLGDADATAMSLKGRVQRAYKHPLDRPGSTRRTAPNAGLTPPGRGGNGCQPSDCPALPRALDLSPPIQEAVPTSDGLAGVGALSKLGRTRSRLRSKTPFWMRRAA